MRAFSFMSFKIKANRKQYVIHVPTIADVDVYYSVQTPKPGLLPISDSLLGMIRRREITWTNTPGGLGDILMLTAVTELMGNPTGQPIWSHSDLFHQVFQHCKSHRMHGHATAVRLAIDALNSQYNLGAGHFLQRLAGVVQAATDPTGQLLGKTDLLLSPRPLLTEPKKIKREMLVALHFNAGNHAAWQRQHIHPRARQVYPENLNVIQEFIHAHKDYTFVALCPISNMLAGVVKTPIQPSISYTLDMLWKAKHFIGIVSGPMHLAAACKVPATIILNFPEAQSIVLPTLVNTGIVESEWLYPQNVHLHQDSHSNFCPRFCRDSLELAFERQLYHYGEYN